MKDKKKKLFRCQNPAFICKESSTNAKLSSPIMETELKKKN